MADEKAEEPKDAAEGESAEEGGSKKKLIIIAIAAVVVAGGGGAAAFLMLGGEGDKPAAASEENTATEGGESTAENAGDSASEGQQQEDTSEAGAAAKEAQAEGEGAGSEAKVNFGETYTFKTFHLNLGNPLENHYIRIDIAVEFKGGETQKAEIEQRLPQLRDAVVSVASRKSREFLLGPDGKDQLRREILIRMNRYMTQPIETVFITDILIE